MEKVFPCYPLGSFQPGLKWIQEVGAKPAAEAAESGEIPVKAAAFGLFKDQDSRKSSALISDSRLGGAS